MMKKKLIILGLCSLALCGCGKENPTLSDGSQAVATFNDEGIQVSANQLYEKMKERYSLDIFLQLMDKQLLEKEYANDLEEAKSEADTTIKSMKDTYGVDQINAYFGSVESYTDYLYTSNLQQKAILDYAKGKVSDNEIKSYYDKNIYGDVVVDHILIKADVDDSASSDDKEKAENEAKDKIKEVIKKLDEADNKLETFKNLAKEYSQDEATKDNGGSLGAINTDTLSSSYDELLKAARELKDGSYSTDVITTELGYHVIYRESSTEKASLDDIKDSVIEKVAKQKLEDDATMSITAMQELRKKYGMEIVDSQVKELYSNYITNSIASAQQSNKN